MKALLLKIKKLEHTINNDKENFAIDSDVLGKHVTQPYFLGLTFLTGFVFTLAKPSNKYKPKLPRKSLFAKISGLSRLALKHYTFLLPLLKS